MLSLLSMLSREPIKKIPSLSGMRTIRGDRGCFGSSCFGMEGIPHNGRISEVMTHLKGVSDIESTIVSSSQFHWSWSPR